MPPENQNPSPPSLLAYEAPRVVEDLPLEAYCIACPPPGGKDSICEGVGGTLAS